MGFRRAEFGDPGDSGDPDDPGGLDEEFPLGDGTADLGADVVCPYCGERVEIALDPGSGADQEYVEDCEVCCRPWRVRVHYDAAGAAHASLEPLTGDWS